MNLDQCFNAEEMGLGDSSFYGRSMACMMKLSLARVLACTDCSAFFFLSKHWEKGGRAKAGMNLEVERNGTYALVSN